MELFFDETQEGAAPVKEGSGETEFAVAMRGYDRVQVDDYLARQEKWVADAQSRMATGDAALAAATSEIKLLRDRLDVLEERELNSSPRSIAALGERVERILAESWQAAEDLRQQSEAQVSARTAELEQHVAEQERRVAEVLRKTERRSADAEEKAKGLLRDAREGAERHTAESE
ncbi:MAG: DivIVA domain-containing protein, partial [Actinomycetota bacterium]|nr:DivIVA domain-containing protein [Actinomycetota bacterium]